MDSSNFSLYSLLIVTSLAVLVPLLVSNIRSVRIPIVVGEILVGVVVGKSGFNIIQQSEWLQFLQFFGLAYLMFVSGLEIDFQALRPQGGAKHVRGFITSAPVFGALTCLLTFGLSYLLSLKLFSLHMIQSPLLLALIITTTSLTVVVPVLKEYQLLSDELGQLLLAAAIFADFVTMSLISVAVSLYQGQFSASVLLVFVLIILLLVMYAVLRRFRGKNLFRTLRHGTAQLGIRASFALMIVFIVLSQTLGVQVILGTFLAGVLVGLLNHRERSDVHHKLDAIGFGFLIPIFFIMIGVNFDVRSLLHDRTALILLPILLVATYLFKGVPALLLRLRFPLRETIAGSVLLTTQMSVTVAAAAVGLKVGAISPGVNTAIILVAMLTSVMSPVVFGKIMPKRKEAPASHVVVIGDGPESSYLVQNLRERNESFVWLCLHPAFRQEVAKDPRELTGLKQIGLDPALVRALFANTPEDSVNLALCERAAQTQVANAVCNIKDAQTYNRVQEHAGFHIVHPQISVVSLVDQLVHYPVSSQLLTSPANYQIQEVRIRNRKLEGRALAELPLPSTLLVLSILRDGTQIVPHGDTSFALWDTAVVVGSNQDIQDFTRMVGG